MVRMTRSAIFNLRDRRQDRDHVPGVRVVSTPSRSRTLSEFTNTFRCRRTVPVSSQTLRYKADWLRSRSSSAARTVCAEIESCAAPAQYVRNGPGTWIVMIGAAPMRDKKPIIGGWDDATKA
jgi:hypothetical protein